MNPLEPWPGKSLARAWGGGGWYSLVLRHAQLVPIGHGTVMLLPSPGWSRQWLYVVSHGSGRSPAVGLA